MTPSLLSRSPRSAWGHSVTLFTVSLIKRILGDFYGIMFFRQDSLKSEGRYATSHRSTARGTRHAETQVFRSL